MTGRPPFQPTGTGGVLAIGGCSVKLFSPDFTQLFDTIGVKDIKDDLFTPLGEPYGILTAGTPDDYNSLVTSFGGRSQTM